MDTKEYLKDREKFMKKIGDSIGIIFNKEERNLYDLFVGKKVLVSLKDKDPDKKEKEVKNAI